MTRRPRYLVVVRRGEEEIFHSLQEHFSAGADPTQVVYDRRVRDRRVIIQDREPERRSGERRAPTDVTMWTKRGFIVVRVDRGSARATGRLRAAGGATGATKSARARRGRRKSSEPGD